MGTNYYESDSTIEKTYTKRGKIKLKKAPTEHNCLDYRVLLIYESYYGAVRPVSKEISVI